MCLAAQPVRVHQCLARAELVPKRLRLRSSKAQKTKNEIESMAEMKIIKKTTNVTVIPASVVAD